MYFGDSEYAEDFHGYLMCKNGYGNSDYYIMEGGERIYCGWNIHQFLIWKMAMYFSKC